VPSWHRPRLRPAQRLITDETRDLGTVLALHVEHAAAAQGDDPLRQSIASDVRAGDLGDAVDTS
jgi:hypothetical protein